MAEHPGTVDVFVQGGGFKTFLVNSTNAHAAPTVAAETAAPAAAVVAAAPERIQFSACL